MLEKAIYKIRFVSYHDEPTEGAMSIRFIELYKLKEYLSAYDGISHFKVRKFNPPKLNAFLKVTS